MIFVLWSFLKALISSAFLPESRIVTIILQEAVNNFFSHSFLSVIFFSVSLVCSVFRFAVRLNHTISLFMFSFSLCCKQSIYCNF
jgi:hypothetical protein